MRGARVLWGRSHEASGAPPYFPWKQVGDSHARFVPSAEIAQDMDPAQGAELAHIFPVLGDPPEARDAASGQFRLFDAYTAFMRAGASRAPLLIVLDDLHWADQPSLLLLQHLARELLRMRILVVGTYRDTDLSRTHPLSEALAELNRESGFQRVVLRGLPEDEVGTYVRAVSGREPTRGLVGRIYEETEGNPFFLSEVVNLMVQEGTLNADSVSDIAIPDGVREAIGRRLNLISEEANELLTTAAVVGRVFPFETLALLYKGDSDELVHLINEGLTARVIEELEQPGRYQFTHAQMQETLLSEISTTSRVHLNGRIAEAPGGTVRRPGPGASCSACSAFLRVGDADGATRKEGRRVRHAGRSVGRGAIRLGGSRQTLRPLPHDDGRHGHRLRGRGGRVADSSWLLPTQHEQTAARVAVADGGDHPVRRTWRRCWVGKGHPGSTPN